MQVYDLVVVGGGPAGYHAAARAGAAGLSTVLVEKTTLGGVCLNEGCIPSKALLHSAKLYEAAKNGERYGVTVEGAILDHGAVLTRKTRVVKRLVAGVAAQLRAAGVAVMEGNATLAGRDGGRFVVKTGGEQLAAEKVLLATGSAPVVPNVPGLSEGVARGFVLTSREMLDLPQVPERLVVVGGGVIGLELASYFCAAGAQVAVVELLSKIGGPLEEEVSAVLQKNLQKKGIRFYLGSRVSAIEGDEVVFENEEGEQRLPADKVLLCVGRRAVSEGLGLAQLGVAIEKGAVLTDEHLCTNVPGIYAAGDVNGKSMLAHTAYREADVAVNHMLGLEDAMRYDAIPSVVYTSPEAAGVGETEESAKAAGWEYTVVKLPLGYSGRYVAEVDAGDGICKLLAEKGSRRLLGVHMVGRYASEIIYGAGMMVAQRQPVEALQKIIFPHPTVGEILREGLFML